MATDRAIRFTFIGEDKSAGRTMDSLAKKSDSLGSRLAGFGRTVAKGVGIAAAGGIAAFGAAMVQGVKDAASFEVLGKKTAAVIKSTGNVANISVGGVQKLAASLESMSGVDEELIINSQNVLATFTKVRNEAGKGNDIFNQGAKAALNMSVALGTDLQSATVMVGKALNDPIRGINAMSRAGIQFTEQQRDQIKEMVEAGDVMGAQKIILGELTTQFGGAAQAAGDTFTGKIARLKDAFGDFFRELGARLLPALGKFADWLRTDGLTYLTQFGGFIRAEILPRLKEFAGFVKDEVVPRLISFGGWLKDNKGVVVGLTAAVGALVAITKIHGAVLAVQAAGGLVAYIKNIKIVQAATKTWAAVQWLLNAALIANPVGLVIAAVAALVAGIVIAWQRSERFREIVKGVFQDVGEKVSTVVQWIKDKWQSVVDFFSSKWAFIREVFRSSLNKAKQNWETAWNGMKRVPGLVVAFVVDKFLWVVEKIVSGAAYAFGWVPELGGKLKKASNDFKEFRKKVNRELTAIDDEAVKINVKTYGNLEFGGAGGRGGAGISMGVGGGGVGGDLDVVPTGLSSSAITNLATDFLGQTKAKLKSVIKSAFESSGFGRFMFPLPRGSYRVGMPLWGYPGHTGQDFPAATGTPVFAPFSGYLLQRNLGNRSYGKFSDLRAGAWRFIGAHLSRFARGSGAVRAGQLIGFVGSTGNSTGPHLHAEFRRNGAVINPRSVLSFSRGGVIPEHVVGVGMRSGRPYQFGENGPETVVPGRGGSVVVSAAPGGDRATAEFVTSLVRRGVLRLEVNGASVSAA